MVRREVGFWEVDESVAAFISVGGGAYVILEQSPWGLKGSSGRVYCAYEVRDGRNRHTNLTDFIYKPIYKITNADVVKLALKGYEKAKREGAYNLNDYDVEKIKKGGVKVISVRFQRSAYAIYVTRSSLELIYEGVIVKVFRYKPPKYGVMSLPLSRQKLLELMKKAFRGYYGKKMREVLVL